MVSWMDKWMDGLYHVSPLCLSFCHQLFQPFFPVFLRFYRIPVVLFLLPGNKAQRYLLLNALPTCRSV